MNQEILLTVTTLQDFITQSLISDTSQIRSLTIAIDNNKLPQTTSIQTESENRNATEGTRQLWSQLERFANLLPAVSNLATFSLNVISKSKNGFWIPRPLIARLIIALPRTCIAIQIDTQGQDLGEPKSAHLCHAIRTILPQLQHMRLRVGTICKNLFRTEAEIIEAPYLETLLINCLGKGVQGHQARLCNSFQEDPYYSQLFLGQEAASDLALSIQALVPHCPRRTHIALIDSGNCDDEDQSVYATLNRRNIMRNTIYSMPFVTIAPFQSDGVLLRTQDKDIIADLPELQAFAEEGLWKATSPEGFMLPANLIEDWG
ncbi:3bfde77f-2be3-40df-854b-51c83487af04-CDS [Sclerotinia trifoliorum]|uniref:3bfde77f-2be3-40df-854b-51c83487af04-CDS n=1 Tax=Sclerotinia trifoliorum TaxID=28548 RepID=A0A8H2ZT24_9HELO|nr:3bfde77f-2be3-40df-854b-51c83487af04-CDS [Sclerotinia trifoliorum]